MLTPDQETMIAAAQRTIAKGVQFLRWDFLGEESEEGRIHNTTWRSFDKSLPPGACACFIGAVAIDLNVDPYLYWDTLDQALADEISLASDSAEDWPSALAAVRKAMEKYNRRQD